MAIRWVHFRLDQPTYERIRAAAAADRRSLSSWIAVACERALVDQGTGSEQEQAR